MHYYFLHFKCLCSSIYNLGFDFRGNLDFWGKENKANAAKLSLTVFGGEPDIFSPRMNTAM